MTTTEAAEILGVSQARVRQLILAGRLPAIKHGRDWMIKRSELLRFTKLIRTPGRPK